MKIKDIIPVALGKELPDVLLKNLKLVNVFTGKIEKTNIALYRKRIAGIGDYQEGKKIIDLGGKYVIPGLIDAHMHLESSMLSPRQFAKIALKNGTTTVIADPHEITNVLGISGIEYMIKSTEGIPLNVYIAIPSAVPATGMETSGARLGPEDIVGFVDRYPRRVIALGEVMNFPGVLNCDPELLTKIEILRHKYKKIDGHSPFLSGKELNAYIDAFIRSDHECTTVQEALEKVGKGMQVFIREGTAAKNFDGLIDAVDEYNFPYFSFCTDDKDPKDILKEGHINYIVKKAIKHGLNPITAIRMATINTARHYNLRSMGAIAPGYKADILVVDDLSEFNISMVIKDSKVVVNNNKLVDPIEGVFNELPESVGKVILPKISVEDLKIKDKNKKIRVIEMFEGSLITKELHLEPKTKNGYIVADSERDIAKIAILERHTGSGYSLGFIKGLSVKNGAVGTTVGHDAHNIGIVGTDDEDMIIAAKELEKMNGGLVIVKNKKVIWKLGLPIAGLMTNENYKTVVETLENQEDALKKIGCEKDIFMTLAFVQLGVIPEIKITDRGIVNVAKQEFVSIYVE
ncbi:adenine deaminase [Tepiditoga spiralis]|uniref:Adenine deaminase n=1 Tax=Tepiditoga spiralis TaxID=2108365 RepID=A0A7G1G7F1_9BACT|nr:adenine deaminase [Tepiditoga spiralis]BBE30803.1 adenine deaminase [Tepiditoga spiralis]